MDGHVSNLIIGKSFTVSMDYTYSTYATNGRVSIESFKKKLKKKGVHW